ncbi:hypothetical protein C7H19_16740 [Aphanothece hegewaldii CCALA 016]|uniref:Uncharacterized protein n=2 Tax=Aphanothece TaxID=1121 RepID=A0A2T1LUX7_9CHRO|nr:hypothetical protein C7H19_16740 [Aphanothece hegewaldii CCALA 016]
MKIEKTIPDAQTRAKNVERWKEVCLMFDRLNAMLDEASAILEAEQKNNPYYQYRQRNKQEKSFLGEDQQTR